MNYLNTIRSNKCFFCEHDRGHLASAKPQCETCYMFNNFQAKKKMRLRQAHDWKKFKEWEEKNEQCKNDDSGR